MVIDKYDQIATLNIWEPRWHKERGKRHVLLACYKVDNARTDHLRIRFTKSEAMKGDWYISRKRAKRFKKDTNGTILCYAVPLDVLEPLEISKHSILELK